MYTMLQEDLKDGIDKPFYESDNSQSKDEEDTKNDKKSYVMDPDHRLLLRNCKPLLQSRNSAVSSLDFDKCIYYYTHWQYSFFFLQNRICQAWYKAL